MRRRSQHNLHKYTPIPQTGWIRLLKLSKDGADPIRGTLLSTALDAAPPFYALSYCWGSWGTTSYVSIDDRILRVTPWLHNALKILNEPDHLSELTPPLMYLWIDQICINQHDLQERAAQVEQMNLIYGSSVRTIVWLKDTDIDRTLDQLLETYRVCRQIESPTRDSNDLPTDANALATLKDRGIPHSDKLKWLVTTLVYHAPWLQRLWVVQEVVLSAQDPIVLIGRRSIPFQVFAGIVVPLTIYLGRSIMQPARCLLIMQELRKNPMKRTLDLLCLNVSSSFLSSDPRDMIYAIIGLAATCPDSDAPAIDMRVDYTITPEEVFQRFVRAWITATRDLTMLCLAMNKDSYLDKLEINFGHELAGAESRSSWIPDFPSQRSWHFSRGKLREKATYANGAFRLLPRSSILDASKDLPLELQPSPLNRHTDLILGGLRVDSIAVTSEIMYRPLPLDSMLKEPKAFVKLVSAQYLVRYQLVSRDRLLRDPITWLKLLPFYFYATRLHQLWSMAVKHATYADIDQLLDSFLFCTTAGFEKDADGNDRPISILRLSGLRDSMIVALHEQSSGAHGPVLAKMRRANARVRELYELCSHQSTEPYRFASEDHCPGLRLFVTKNGRLGTGSPATKAGDAVTVLFGGQTPFTMRKREGGRWQFLGQCWVHSLANGEAIEQMRAGRLEREVFTIR